MYLSKEQKDYLKSILINDGLRLSNLSDEYSDDEEEVKELERKMDMNNKILNKLNKS